MRPFPEALRLLRLRCRWRRSPAATLRHRTGLMRCFFENVIACIAMAGKKRKGRSAWLVTRHWRADYPRWEVALILSGRIGGCRVREFVELLGVASCCPLQEQAALQWSKYGQAPYPAQFGQTKESDPWEGEIHCGDDPYLHARIVDELTVERDVEGKEKTTWKERQRASSARMHAEQNPKSMNSL
jgi:hypothetical protein